ncbi:MAG: hypothetical protein AAFO29_15955, partial [Actinomycetota bacterium]
MRSALVRGWRRLRPSLVLSRHSALPVLRRRLGAPTRSFAVRALSLACGSTMIGSSITLMVAADLGLPPYDVLSSGLGQLLGITLGQAGWVLAGTLFAAAALLGQRPGPWSVAYILANGLVIDATAGLVNQPSSLIGQIGFLLAAIGLMAGGVNLVLFSGTTGGPFELLMTAGEQRGLSRVTTRSSLDIGVLASGIALGGAFGVGTVL